MLKIDHDIPIPEAWASRKSLVVETAEKLGVGDSFLVEGSYGIEGKLVYRYGDRSGKRFSLRKDPDNPKCVRVWRIK
jgi:hypothetical protein